ncbi:MULTISPECIES: hypothetical protein [Serratia]|nr:hypothetical protein [Serratia proteamaculans]
MSRIPVKKLRVSDGKIAFDYSIDDIAIIGKVVLTIK